MGLQLIRTGRPIRFQASASHREMLSLMQLPDRLITKFSARGHDIAQPHLISRQKEWCIWFEYDGAWNQRGAVAHGGRREQEAHAADGGGAFLLLRSLDLSSSDFSFRGGGVSACRQCF